MQELVKEGVEKTGSRRGLWRETGLHWASTKEILEGERNIISVGALKNLLDLLDKPHSSVNEDIIAIGSGSHLDAIRNPHLPFSFDTPEGATLIAAALKDGCVDIRRRFKYANRNEANRERIKKAIRTVFGDIAPSIVGESKKTPILDFRSHIIGEALEKAGIPVGRKIFHSYRVPEFIREGSPEVKEAYMFQTLMDEGTWKHHYVAYAQSVSIEEKLTDHDREYLRDHVGFKERVLGKAKQHYANITKGLEEKINRENPHLWEVIESSRPPNIDDESSILEDICGVKADIRPVQIYYTKTYGYRVS